MDRTKAKLASFFNNDEEDDSAFTQKSVDDTKLSQYAQGTAKKSKREKEKEREAARRAEEEELAAKTYAEFLDAFEGPGAQRKGGFVKASVSGGGGGEQTSRAYNPIAVKESIESKMEESPPPASAPKPKGKRAMDAFLEEIKREQAERESRLSRHSHTQGRSVTALAAYEGQSGSRDRGDPLTSNVFVANLPPHVNEMILGNFFAQRCGPVGSVKIMWPRGDATAGPGAEMTASRSRKNAGLSGFVSFMKRKDAEAAVRELDGFDWGGSVLRVGWSKAVPIAAKAAYVADRDRRSHSRSRSRSTDRDHGKRRREHSRSSSRERGHRRSHSRDHRRRSRSYTRSRSRGGDYDRRSRSRSRSHSRRRRYDSRSYSRSRSRSPSRSRRRRSYPPRGDRHTGVDPEMEKFVRMVAQKVKEHGESFEDVLRERERENPKFAFLFDQGSPEHHLYRSLILGKQLIQGFDDEGYNSVYSTDSAEESERERVRKHILGKLARKRLEAMLRALTGRQGEIARCMAFSLEHAEAASEVCDIIVGSLLVDSTPVPRKVARLHLICDILHNSAASVPNAWKYRQEFQSRLGIVFDHLSSIYHSFPGRITAETFKKQITVILDVWEDWIVFPSDFIEALKSRLDGSSAPAGSSIGGTGIAADESARGEMQGQDALPSSKFKSSAFKPATIPTSGQPDNTNDGEDMNMSDSDKDRSNPVDDDVDGAPMDDVDGEPMDGAPLDGEPIDGEPIDGEPIDGESIDGEPLDGGPIDADPIDGDPLDGEPIDDIDGAPM